MSMSEDEGNKTTQELGENARLLLFGLVPQTGESGAVAGVDLKAVDSQMLEDLALAAALLCDGGRYRVTSLASEMSIYEKLQQAGWAAVGAEAQSEFPPSCRALAFPEQAPLQSEFEKQVKMARDALDPPEPGRRDREEKQR